MPLPLNNNELSYLVDDLPCIDPVSSREIETKQKYSDLWPELNGHAYYGLAGEIVKAIEPYTESDSTAILINLLTAFGNCLGLSSYFQVEHRRHYLRLFSILVGKSAIGRKGSSWSTIRYMFDQIESDWVQERIVGGLSSGEGLVNEVRDKRTDKRPVKDKGRIVDYIEETVDQGVSDKRLLVVEEEFAQVLKVSNREGNILSDIIRKAWDDGNLRIVTKSNPIRATSAHISIIGHISKDELLRYLNDTEQANGFGNRFLWFLVKRSKLIPNPTGTPLTSLNSLISQLQERIVVGRRVSLLARDTEAEIYWSKIYLQLTEEKEGLIGSLTARAPVQVMRIACVYALLDKSQVIKIPHLKAALAVWEYSEHSVSYIFGDSVGDPYADRILSELRQIYPDGMTETEIWKLFGNHGGKRIQSALKVLNDSNLITVSKGEPTGGRLPKVWRAAKKAKYANKVYLDADEYGERSELSNNQEGSEDEYPFN